MRFTAIDFFQLFQAIQVDQGESGILNRSEIAAASLHRQDAYGLSGKWIGEFYFRAGVAAAEICDSQIRAQQIRTIAQQ